MSNSPLLFPSREAGLAFHLQLCDLNPAAVADVCRAYLDPLLGWLERKFPKVDPDLRQTAVHIALMGYVQKPQCYDSGRSDLAGYLRMAARGDLTNLLEREGKHWHGRISWSVVEDDAKSGNIKGEDEPSLQIEHAEETQQWRDFLETVAERFTATEQRALELMMAGERKTEVYAKVLCLEALPVAEQEREVKQVKDRIKKRLQRGVPGHA